MEKRGLVNRLCLSGILALLFYLLHDIVGARLYPGYAWTHQAVSDLTSVTAPSYVVASGLSHIYALFACLCCTLLSILVVEKGNRPFRLGTYLFAAMQWVSAVGYALFPLSDSGYAGTVQDIMHTFVVTGLVVLLSIASLALIAVGAFRMPRQRRLGVCAIAALTAMFAGAIGSGLVPQSVFGIFERFSTYGAVLFTACFGLFGFWDFPRQPAKPS